MPAMGALKLAPIPAPAPAATRLFDLVDPEAGVARERRSDRAADEDDRTLSSTRTARAQRHRRGHDLRSDEPRWEVAPLQVQANHGLGNAAAGNIRAEPPIEEPCRQEAEGNRDEKDPLPEAEERFGLADGVRDQLQPPDEDGRAHTDQNAEQQRRGEKCCVTPRAQSGTDSGDDGRHTNLTVTRCGYAVGRGRSPLPDRSARNA